jgi:hypothetical protein
MFVIGPAAEEMAMPFLGSLKLAGLIGTGFAYPKMTPPNIINMSGIITVPMGSICLIGFSVNRPMNLAVGSPSLLATYPCETSWSVIAKINAGTDMIRCLMVLASIMLDIVTQIIFLIHGGITISQGGLIKTPP